MGAEPALESRRLKTLHLELVAHVFRQRRSDQLARFFAPDHRLHCELLPPDDWVGSAGFARLAESLFQRFSHTLPTVLSQWSTPTRCATQLSVVGQHVGAIGKIPPTLRWPTVRMLLFSEASAGRLTASWLSSDALAVLAREEGWRVPRKARLESSEAFDDGD